MRRLLLTSLLLVLGCSWVAGSADARTYMAPCVGPGKSGPMCHFWTARAVSINDGDTIGVRVDGQRRVWQVRFTGVQATELHHYSQPWAGECNSVEAAKRVQQLVRGSHHRVLLSAQHPGKRFTYRLGRWIAVKVHGHWRDLGALEMAEGHTLWMSDEQDTAWNKVYNRLGQQAEQKHIGLWDPTHCGVGPDQDVPLRVWVQWDPHGIDASNMNDEWVKVQNLSTTKSLPLTHWWIRDSGLRRYTFPRDTVLHPGATITIHDGAGQNSATDLFWNIGAPVFQNIGDGAYLFDPQGDIRASMVYPCVVACSDPNQGALSISAQVRGQQFVQIANVSDHPVNLYGYQLTAPGWPYDFGPNSVLQPGQTMRVDLDGAQAQDTQLDRHWGTPYPHLHRGGEAVRVNTFNGITIACDSWGGASCS
ncbi:MAG TPA: lamin tail domain-containing protein [Gemmatimonadaceae bacterium]|nr:lamin tail domain-containing protein [Gemmatimonadaceae bacterium]